MFKRGKQQVCDTLSTAEAKEAADHGQARVLTCTEWCEETIFSIVSRLNNVAGVSFD